MRMNLLTLLVAAGLLAGCATNVTHRERGYTDLRNQDYAAALEHFQAAVDRKSTDYNSQYHLGLTLLKLDRPVPAQTPLEQALALRPDDPQWTDKIADALAESYFQQDRIDTLYAFLDNQVESRGRRYEDFLRTGKFMAKAGDADGAKLALQKAAYFAPMGDPVPYLAIADFYASVNDLENRVQALQYALYMDPDLPETRNRLEGLGIVPGPTQYREPPKPEIVTEAQPAE